MPKPIFVITHERSGTHLLINSINFNKKGQFLTIGYSSDEKDFNLKGYRHITYKDVITNAYVPNSVSKSHHQVEFMTDYLDYLFSNYKVIYVLRDVKDVLTSYYKFIPFPSEKNFPLIDEWVFSDPEEIARKFLQPYFPDPHVITKPKNYVHRWLLHKNGWLKHKNNMLVVNYEDVLLDYKTQKIRIEDFISKKIADQIPDVNDKTLPNFGPVKGKIGSHKEMMSGELIGKINSYLLKYDS